MIDEYHQEELQTTKFEEGKTAGRLEGERNGKMEVASALLWKGLSVEMIAEATGLSLADILALQEKRSRDE